MSRDVQQRPTREHQRPQAEWPIDRNRVLGRPSMAEHVQAALGPFGGTDPWQEGRGWQEQNAPSAGHDGTHHLGGLRLVTEKALNTAKFTEEQDKQNKVHRAKLSKQTKDYVDPKGPEGVESLSAMMWAESPGRNTRVAD